MNYRHAFHAGNFADVWKHLVLVLCMDHLRLKETPFRVIDAFAGTGLYDLGSPEAARNPEWRDGIARVREAAADGHAPASVARYLSALEEAAPEANAYPGSPALIASLLRDGDRAVFCELHEQDAETLRNVLAGVRRAKVEQRDGWQATRAHLPPVERRGLTLIDPPFEVPGEHDRLAQCLEEGLSRFATGIFILWHADKNSSQTNAYRNSIAGLGARVLAADMRVEDPAGARGLVSAGLTIANPPHTLEAALQEAGRWLTPVLARGAGARHTITRISGTW